MQITEKNGIKRLLPVLPIFLLAVGIGAWALLSRKPEKHKSAMQPSTGGTVSLTYSDAVSIHLADAQVILEFANPAKPRPKNTPQGCFCPTGRKASDTGCSIPPAQLIIKWI